MYVLASQIKNLPVLSLQTGQTLATVVKPLVKLENLEIAALSCTGGMLQRKNSVILMRDVRQIASDCVIVDSFEDIEDAGEIVRLKDIVKADFDPIGKKVANERQQPLGKVEDYTINLESHLVQKLYVQQSMLKNILFNSLVIDRTQIIDVTPKQFMVKDATASDLQLVGAPAPAK